MYPTVLQAWLSADRDPAWPCRGHSLVFHLRLVSKLLPAKAMTFLVEMFRKGNAAVIFGDGKFQFCIYSHREYVLSSFNVSSHKCDLWLPEIQTLSTSM